MAVVVDLVGIKEQIRSILTDANTTTASPVYLSNNLSLKVQQILKINPSNIPPQASFFPMVTSYIDSKSIEQADIIKDQLTAKFKAIINVKVVGIVWNDSYTTQTVDPSDDDINYLMENIELALRANTTLNGKVTWQITNGTEYFNQSLDEQTHLRAGVLSLRGQVYY